MRNLNLEAANPSDPNNPYISVGFTDGNFAYNAGSTSTAASLMVSASPHLVVNLPAIGITFDQTLPTVSVNFFNGTLFSFNFHVNMNLGFVDLNIPTQRWASASICHVEEKLTELVHREPFVPFVVELNDGESLIVPHPPAFDENGAVYFGPMAASSTSGSRMFDRSTW